MGRFQPINKGQFLGSSGRLELIGKKTKGVLKPKPRFLPDFYIPGFYLVIGHSTFQRVVPQK